MPNRVKIVREALEKVVAQGSIGTVDIPRCIEYLKTAERDWTDQSKAIVLFKTAVLNIDSY